MMIFAGHLGIALITAYLIRQDPLLLAIGGILPDLDAILSILGASFGKTHRKITHSLILPITTGVLSIWLPILIPITIGIIIHFITDMDHWGIPLLYPLKKEEYSLFKMDHTKNYKTTSDAIKEWFKNRDKKFYLEWALLIIGIILTKDYFINLIF